MTAVDLPDNGQDEGRSERGTDLRGLRLGMGIGTPAALASARAGAGEQQRERVARWLFETFDDADEWSVVRLMAKWGTRWYDRADELLALLDRTQPDDDPGPQCPSTSHDTDGGWRCEHRAGHDLKVKHKNREKEW